MLSPLIVAADALASVLNDRDTKVFALEFAAERSYADWEMEPGDNLLHVDVVPVGYRGKGGKDASDLASRGSLIYRPQIDLGIRKKFGFEEQTQDGRVILAEADALLGLLDEIHEYLVMLPIGDDAEFQWIDTEFRASFVRQAMDDSRMYIGILRITYDYTKEIE